MFGEEETSFERAVLEDGGGTEFVLKSCSTITFQPILTPWPLHIKIISYLETSF